MAKKVKNMFKNNMVLCVLVLVAIGVTSVVFAADVTVKQGIITGDELIIDTNSLVVDPNGNVGIGTANPSNSLTVHRSGRFYHTTQHLNYVRVDGIGDTAYFGIDESDNAFVESANHGISFYTEQDPPIVRMHITESGNVGIGTLDPSCLLDVNGVANVSGNITLGDASTDTITCNGRWIPRTVAADPTSTATAGSLGEIVFYNDKWYGKTVADGTDTNWSALN